MTSVIRGSDNFDSAGGNAVKAWVNFNGTGTPAIRAAFNVSSITDHNTGDYTVNFATAMPDANYAVAGSAGTGTVTTQATTMNDHGKTTAGFRVRVGDTAGAGVDRAHVQLIFCR